SGETIYADAYDFEHNIVRYLSNGVVANNVHTVHDNLFEHINNSYDPADHPNVLETNAEADSDNYVYNNIFRYNQAAVGIWTVAAAGHTDHYFNNVIFDSSSGGDANNDNCWMVSGNTGSTVYFINNTFDAPCRIRNTGNAPFTPPFVGNEYLYNNHLIGYGSLSDLAGTGDNGANATIIERTDTYETEAAANAQGYTASDNYAPANSSGATVNAGTNYTGLSMPGLAADILGVFRPATGPWSTGAYQVNGVAIQQTPGTDIYVSQNGSGTGTSCADPLPISWANATSNWGTSAGQIGPGVTLHLCGTFTGAAGATLLKAQGSGTAGHPITIKFEPGAVAAAPYWAGSNNPGGGAIDISMKSYIILDGGTNGLIENTKNGTGLAYHADSVGVMAEGCEDCEIKNLTIADMYVHTSPSDTSVDQTQVIGIEFSGTNTSVHNNTIHDAGWALGDVYNVGVLLRGGNDISGGDNDSLIYGNDIYNIDHGIWLAGYGVAQTIKVFGNHIHDYANWDTTSNAYHHDGIHAFGWPATSTSFAKINDLWIYDNLFDGDPGNNVTGHVFLEGWNATSDPTPWTDSTGMLHFFNNIGVFPNGRLTYNGIFAIMYAGSNFQIYNNTVVGSSPTAGGSVCLGVASPNPTIKNNVIEGCNVLIGSVTQINNPSQIDYNTYGDCDNSYNCWWDLGPGTGDFTKWLSISGGADAHSTYHSNIDLDSNYRPLAGSPAIGSALNLTGLGTAPLDSDIVGTARPASSAWDAGAYQSGSNQVFTTSGSSAAASGSTSGSSGTTGGTTSGTSGGGGVSTGGGGVGGGGFGGGASINASTNSGTNSPTPNSPTTPCSSSPSVIPASALSLTIGTRGPEVTNLQTFLVIMGYLNRSYITGYFGPLTKAALNSYVASHPSTCRSNIQAPSNNNQTNSNNQISTFTRSLKLGMIGRDVKNLQIFLNQHNFTVSQYGPGSSGHETTYFGPATFRAVIRFQNAYANQILAPYGLSRGTGFFGPSTMKEVNAMRGL
ncbi:MAG: peptidoglycan-binding protein, partial [Patescibacteria group bacterium]|nr:peptidoglycan-binding protein [Patescibacteria group bacterium]